MRVWAGVMAAAAASLAGCQTPRPNSKGTAALPYDPYGVTGRDLGRGGATTGGVSSMDPTNNASDLSVPEARELEAEQR